MDIASFHPKKDKYRLAINGFGRIGRCLLRLFLENYHRKLCENIEIVAINSPNLNPDNASHFLQYDSTHGTLAFDIRPELDNMQICAEIPPAQPTQEDIQHLNWLISKNFGSHNIPSSEEIMGKSKLYEDIKKKFIDKKAKNSVKIKILSESTINKLDWKELGVDLVLETSGKFTSRSDAMLHIERGAKHVIIGAPAPEADFTCIIGVNENLLNPQKNQIISLGSCTTNCLSPILKVVDEAFSLQHASVTTIHAYTNDQSLLDASHKDLRRARSAPMSIIPSATGLNSALKTVFPQLADRIQGSAFRVPVANVSLIDFNFSSKNPVSSAVIEQKMQEYAAIYPHVMSISKRPLVSIDYNHSSYSCIYDSSLTQIIAPNSARICAWYDNEWGFTNRLLELCAVIAKHKN